jgi:cytoskeletal protein CcmA (bactofilin family)
MAWLNRPKTETGPDGRPAESTEEPEAPAPVMERERTMVDKIVNIGQSIQIKGELTGNEDLTIEGKVEGKIFLKDHNLTIGANGRITAEIHAKTVMVVGEVVGNISADDKVELAPTGSMKGDIVSPRVVLADGARFKGSIDMDRKSAAPAMAATSKSAMPDFARPVGAKAGD